MSCLFVWFGTSSNGLWEVNNVQEFLKWIVLVSIWLFHSLEFIPFQWICLFIIHSRVNIDILGINKLKWTGISSVPLLSCVQLCDPMNSNTPGFPTHQQLPELTRTHVHWVSDAIQPSHPLLSSSPPAFSLSQHQGLFQWVISHQVANVLEFQLQHQSFQWIVRIDFL